MEMLAPVYPDRHFLNNNMCSHLAQQTDQIAYFWLSGRISDLRLSSDQRRRHKQVFGCSH